MRGVDVRFALALVAIAGLSGCAANRATPQPVGWRPLATVAELNPHGGWITIETAAPAGPVVGRSNIGFIVEGELIAIDRTAFHVLTPAGLQAVPLPSSRRITLVAYSPSAGALAFWAVAGGISTWSHGGYLIFTAPMWTISGIVAYRSEKHAGTIHDAERARAFARFPQGLPPGFDPKSLGVLPFNRRNEAEKVRKQESTGGSAAEPAAGR